MKIIIFGPQASGKGTQAAALAEKLNIPQISSGELLRENIKNQTELGSQAESYIRKGQLVPDQLVIKMIAERLAQPDARAGFILDGFPRTLAQAESLAKISQIDQALEIWIPDEVACQRIAGRRTCQNCGAIYHLQTRPPKQAGLCDFCNGPLIIREDDQTKAIKNRLSLYHQQTEPLLDFYRQQGKLIKIDGRPSISAVNQEVSQKLNL